MIFLHWMLSGTLLLSATHIKSLKDASTLEIQSLRTDPRVAIVFQPDCEVCRQQVKDLSCFKEQDKVVLLGAFSNEEALRKEYRKMKVSYPVYYASQDVHKVLKIRNTVTPQVLILAKSIVRLGDGYKECDSIKTAWKKAKSGSQ